MNKSTGYEPTFTWSQMQKQIELAVKKETERIIALNAPAIEECNTYIANLEKELQFTQKRLADLELSICQRAFINQKGEA